MPVELAWNAHEHDGVSLEDLLTHDPYWSATLDDAGRARDQGRSGARVGFAQRLIPMSDLGRAVDVFTKESSTGGLER